MEDLPSYQEKGSSAQFLEKQQRRLKEKCTRYIWQKLYLLHSHSFGPDPFLGHHAPREQRNKKGSPNYPPPWKGSACEQVCIQDLCVVCPPLQPCGGPMLPISPSLPADEIEYEKKLFLLSTDMKSHPSSDGLPHFFLESTFCPSRLHALFDFLKNSWHPNKPEHECAQNIMKTTSGKISWPWPSLNRITFWPLRHSPARSVVLDVFKKSSFKRVLVRKTTSPALQ